jgi:cytochrome P450
MVQTNFSNYIVGRTRQEVTSDFLGRGIFTEDDAFWRTQRYLAKPAFENQRLEAMLPVFAEHSHTMVRILNDAAAKRQAIDLENLFMRCAHALPDPLHHSNT